MISSEKEVHGSKWALVDADRIDPARNGHFPRGFDENEGANKMRAPEKMSKLYNYFKCLTA
jgi:hypothetical protein